MSLARSAIAPNSLPAGTGSGTVTHSAGALTSNRLLIGNGTDDLKVLSAGTAGQQLVATSTAPAWLDPPWLNVKHSAYGATGDGTTDDTAAILAAQTALPATGGVIYFPPGTYVVTGSGLILSKSHTRWCGAGRTLSIIKAAISNVVQPGAISYLVFEDLGFDGAATAGNIINLNRNQIGPTRISRCYFKNLDGGRAIVLSGASRVTIEDCLFQGNANGTGTAISMAEGVRDVYIRRNRFHYLYSGIVVDSGVDSAVAGTDAVNQSERVSEFITIESNDFDMGWWLITARASGSGGTVTYTSTTITDSGASFPTLGTNDNVRIMPVRSTGTGTFSTVSSTVVDGSATFVTAGIRRGDIVRTGTSFAVVRNVETETKLWIEEWLSDTDRAPVAPPSSGTYTVYGIYIGKRVSNTATSVTVSRWQDFDGTSVTPVDGTRYEVLYTHPNYQINTEGSVRDVKVLHNVVRRGWSDQVSLYGYKNAIIGNLIEDGNDMGCTLHGDHNRFEGNTVRHNGGSGLFTSCKDSTFAGNVFEDNPWLNPTDSYLADMIFINEVKRCTIVGNVCTRTYATNGHYGIAVAQIAGGSFVQDNHVALNSCTGHTVAGIRVMGADCTGTRVYDNKATLLVDNSATLADQRGAYGASTAASAGTGATVTGSDHAGTLTIGTAPGTPTITFKAPYSAAPAVLLNSNANAIRATSVTSTGFTITGTVAAGDKVSWIAVGQP